jgi:hypothetical protein
VGGESQFTEVKGPSGIKIGLDGDVYILDQVNRRILWFDALFGFKGKVKVGLEDSATMAQDDQANIYIPCGWPNVLVVSKNLAVFGQFTLGIKAVDPIAKAYFVPKTGKMIFYGIEDQYEIDTKEVQAMAKGERPWGLVNTRKLGYRLVEAMEVNGVVGKVTVRLPGTGERLVFNPEYGKYLPVDQVEYLGQDKSGRAYFTEEVVTSYNDTARRCLAYVIEMGGQTQTFALDRDDKLFYYQHYLADVDANGNVYHLLQRKTGLVLVKWSR